MFGIGPTELLVVAVLALMMFSPRELPKIIRSISQLWGSLRRTADEFRDAIMQEEAMQDLKDAVDGTKAELRDVEGAARRELMKARMEARRAENKLVKVARERERIEREAAAKAMAEGVDGEGEGGGESSAASSAAQPVDGDAGAPLLGRDAGAAKPATPVLPPPAPAGTVASAAPVVAAKTVDPRHAAAVEPAGEDPQGDASANQGAA
ncbi:MAG: hypothetical protein AB1Z98_05760 [Nannocystaceae bacterium]